MSLGKKDIIKNISSKALFSSSDSSKFLEFFIRFIKENNNKNIKISNFGTFIPHTSPKRIGRNPKTKQEFIIQPRKKVKFKASSHTKSILNWQPVF